MKQWNMWEYRKDREHQRERARDSQRKREGNGKQVRTALTESNGGHMERLICDSSGSESKEGLKTKHYAVTLALPANVSPAGGHKKV